MPSSASHRTMPNPSFVSVFKSGIKTPTAVTSSVQHKIHQINTNKHTKHHHSRNYARAYEEPKHPYSNARFFQNRIMTPLTIATWNANGVLHKHKLEPAQFLADRNIDVMLLSETHLTEKYNFQIPGYKGPRPMEALAY